VILDESRDEIPDTVAHECAHVLAYAEHGNEIQPHGREWRKSYRHCKRALAT
jgi:predicted SprT family Zn-dependent metalloprotease